jgi:hypothetical protein
MRHHTICHHLEINLMCIVSCEARIRIAISDVINRETPFHQGAVPKGPTPSERVPLVKK